MRFSTLLFLFLIISSKSLLAIDSLSCEKLFQKGEFHLLKHQLDSVDTDWAWFFKGRIAKEEGDIDLADFYWSTSYSCSNKNVYQTTLFYTLKSNFYYEKIEPIECEKYLDSALHLIPELSGFKNLFFIRLLLGQSLKMRAMRMKGVNASLMESIYKKTFEQYLLAEEDIIEHKLGKFYLAKTYHLLGNANTDLVGFFSNRAKNKNKSLYHFSQAEEYYNKAENIWKNEFGLNHYQLGTTYLVHGLLFDYIDDSFLQSTNEKASSYYKKSLSAFGVNSNTESSFVSFTDVLMAFTHYHRYLVRELGSRKERNTELQAELEKSIQNSTTIWRLSQKRLKSKNKNLNLSIYRLNPYIDVINYENWKIQNHLTLDTNLLNEANINLKYRDVLNTENSTPDYTVNDIKASLDDDEMILNYQFAGGENYILTIYAKDTFWVKQVKVESNVIKAFNDAILNLDFDEFVKYSTQLYEKLIPSTLKNKIIVCPDGLITSVPFESLLVSNVNIKKRDYRTLDYMLFHHEFRYILSPIPEHSRKVSILPNLVLASPKMPDTLSALPFSEESLEILAKKYNGTILNPKNIKTKNIFDDKPTIFHLSSHGIESQNNFEIILTDEKMSLDNLDKIESPADLIVLNTCISSHGKYFYGEGKNSFLRAFSMLGSSGVISTLWRVDDKKSNQLLQQFYEHLYDRGIASEALSLAMKDRIELAKTSKLGAPYYWASHRLNGKKIELVLDKNEQSSESLFFKVLVGCIILLILLPVINYIRTIQR